MKIFEAKNIVGAIRGARMRWAGQVILINEGITKKVVVSQLDGARPRGRSGKRWIERDLRELGVRNWKVAAENRQIRLS